MKELAIGEEIRIRCVEDKDKHCSDCIFCPITKCTLGLRCSEFDRPDHKWVHYELIDTPEPLTLPTDEEICSYSSMYFTGSAIHYIREGMRIMKKMIEEKLNQKDKDNEGK